MISTRTPEGTPNYCPICHSEIRVEPSKQTLDGPCPHCGHLLWFGPAKPTDRRQLLINHLLQIATDRFGLPSCEIRTAIESVVEIERLERMLKLTLKCDNWDQLCANVTR